MRTYMYNIAGGMIGFYVQDKVAESYKQDRLNKLVSKLKQQQQQSLQNNIDHNTSADATTNANSNHT